MKIALISDLHVHDWSEFRTTDDGLVPSRLLHCVSVLDDMHAYCNEHGIACIVIAGDIFHKRNVVYTQPYDLVVDRLVKLKRDRILRLAVDGNHDHANKAGTIHTIDTLWSAGLVDFGVPIVDGWANWFIEGDDEALVISAFSYCDSRELLEKRLELAARDYKKNYRGVRRIGVFHHGFKGARVGSALEYVVKEDIEPAQLADHFDFVFSGHYHGHQLIGGMWNAMYLGSPLQHVRGEGPEAKGFTVYDSTKNTAKLVPLTRPRFVKLTQKKLDELLSDGSSHDNIITGNFVDYHYKSLSEPWEKMLEVFTRRGAAGVKPVQVRRTKTVNKKRLDVDPALDTKTVLERYVAHRKNDIKHLDRADLLRVGMDLFTRAAEE